LLITRVYRRDPKSQIFDIFIYGAKLTFSSLNIEFRDVIA